MLPVPANEVIYCGGAFFGIVGTRECFSLDLVSNEWTQVGNMTEAKFHAGASAHPTRGLIQTGGFTAVILPGMTAVESTPDGVTFDRSYARMPQALGSHCQVGLKK